MSIGAGIPYPIDGPAPIAHPYGLVQAARSPVVRILEDGEAVQRWINGVQVYPFPPDSGFVYDACSAYDSSPETKALGLEWGLPRFSAVTAYQPISCSAYSIGSEDAFRARAVAVLGAVESPAVEVEFMSGNETSPSPHLADGNGTFPNGNASTSVANAFALLENEIAKSGRRGVIHCSPGMALTAAGLHLLSDSNGVLVTAAGTVVVAGQGYAIAGSHPAGKASGTITKEWVYATGPIDIRRSEVFTLPGTLAEALDRGLGATAGGSNMVTYRAERYYLVIWDGEVQAAVLADRCATTC